MLLVPLMPIVLHPPTHLSNSIPYPPTFPIPNAAKRIPFPPVSVPLPPTPLPPSHRTSIRIRIHCPIPTLPPIILGTLLPSRRGMLLNNNHLITAPSAPTPLPSRLPRLLHNNSLHAFRLPHNPHWTSFPPNLHRLARSPRPRMRRAMMAFPTLADYD